MFNPDDVEENRDDPLSWDDVDDEPYDGDYDDGDYDDPEQD